MRDASRHPAGFTLLEVLMVIALAGVLTAMVLPSAEPSVNEQLRATARILATDLAYARSLAVTNNSRYRVAFDVEGNRYVIEHSGGNPSLDLLPESPFSRTAGRQRQMVVDLDDLPRLGARVRLEAAAELNWSVRKVEEVEFGPLGETAASGWTVIWLGAGSGDRSRYTWLLIHPVTGLAEVGHSTTTAPPQWLTAEGT